MALMTLVLISTLIGSNGAASVNTEVIITLPKERCIEAAQKLNYTTTHKKGADWFLEESHRGVCI